MYLDTSVLVPLLIYESNSDAIERWMARSGTDGAAISDWAVVEFASAVGRKVREKRISASQAAEVRRTLQSLAAESLIVFTPTHADFTRAADYLGNPALGLRAGDALHLAIAVNHGALPVYSLDRMLMAAGRKLRIKVENPV